LSTRDWIELALTALLVVNLVALTVPLALTFGHIRRVASQMDTTMRALQEETTATLQETSDALARVEKLSASLDKVVREEVAPTLQLTRATLEHVEGATRNVSEGLAGVRRIVGTVETVSTPAGLMAATGKMVQTPGGRLGLLAVALGTGLKVAAAQRHTQRPAPAAKEQIAASPSPPS